MKDLKKTKYVVIKDGFVKFTGNSFELAKSFYDSLCAKFPNSNVVFRF